MTATNASEVTITGSDGSTYTLARNRRNANRHPGCPTTYTATATGPAGNATATATVTVDPGGSIQAINHVIFMLQENRTFDNYFGMLNPYRKSNDWNIGDDGKDYDSGRHRRQADHHQQSG